MRQVMTAPSPGAGGRAPNTIRVVVADDALLTREGIVRLLTDAGMDVVGQATDADTLLREVALSRPDVAVVDIRMPPTHTDEGLVAARRIRTTHADTGVLVLSQYVELGLAMRLLGGGPDGLGYLLKDRVTDVEEFADAVRRVGEGGSALDPTVVSQLLARRQTADELSRLTPREHEVLKAMAEGLSNPAIADRLHVSLRAVEKHVTNIFDKLGVTLVGDRDRRVLAVLRYLRG
jgi:DNA-binding NarL/FixJ family response regulator